MHDNQRPDESAEDVFRRDAESIWDQHQAAKETSNEPLTEAMQHLVKLLEHLSQYPHFDFDTVARDLNLTFKRDPNLIASKWKDRIATLHDGPFSKLDLSVWPDPPYQSRIELTARPKEMPVSYKEIVQVYGMGTIVDVVHIDHWGEGGHHWITSGFTIYQFEPLNRKSLSMGFFTDNHLLRSVYLATNPER